MRIKFNPTKFVYARFTVVIVLNIGERLIRRVADGVSAVISLSPEQIRPIPNLRSSLEISQSDVPKFASDRGKTYGCNAMRWRYVQNLKNTPALLN